MEFWDFVYFFYLVGIKIFDFLGYCDGCEATITGLFHAAMFPDIQNIVIDLVNKSLTCPNDSIFCALSNEEINVIYNYVGEKYIFNQNEAHKTCLLLEATQKCNR